MLEKKPKILFADESDLLNDFVPYLEEQLDCEIERASILDTVIKKLSEGKYDLLILELFLPIIGSCSGDYSEKYFRKIISIPDRPAIILATSYQQLERYPLEKRDRYLSKPYSIKELLKIVRQMLAKP